MELLRRFVISMKAAKPQAKGFGILNLVKCKFRVKNVPRGLANLM